MWSLPAFNPNANFGRSEATWYARPQHADNYNLHFKREREREHARARARFDTNTYLFWVNKDRWIYTQMNIYALYSATSERFVCRRAIIIRCVNEQNDYIYHEILCTLRCERDTIVWYNAAPRSSKERSSVYLSRGSIVHCMYYIKSAAKACIAQDCKIMISNRCALSWQTWNA